MDMAKKNKILIVDDHAIVRQGLRDFLERESDFTICGEAAGRADALQLCATTNPHLVLIDLSLGKDSGLDLIKDIAVKFPLIKTLVLSMQDEELYAERVLRAGASGFVSKSTHPNRLVEAARCVLGGRLYASEETKQKTLQAIQQNSTGPKPVGSLSDRELAVFEQIGKGRGTVEIAEAMNLSVKTIETYRARIKDKLKIRTAPELVREAVQWAFDKT